jgi:hypothetical protein
MKIAARFPIQSVLPILIVIILFHLLILTVSIDEFGLGWQQVIIIPVLIVSFAFSSKHYQKLTQSPDDLCWNGSSWLMHKDDKLKNAFYLDLKTSSWVSSQLCLLCFTCEENEYCWVFSRYQLGERMFSQLNYLVKQSLKSNMKELS